jgi:hypothetical protein
MNEPSNKHSLNANMENLPSSGFADAVAIMYSPFGEYIERLFPLMLEHVWYMKEQGKLPVQDELFRSGWICRLVTLDSRVLDPEKQNEIPGWPEIREYLVRYLAECTKEKQVRGMIDRCMKILLPLLERRFENGCRFPERKFHSWWYTIHDDETHLALHLVNAYQPESPFNHLPHFLNAMLAAVEDAIGYYPAIRIVSCGSWLNGVPKFQKLWPENFRKDQRIINETGGLGPGIWGQYMVSDGRFDEEKAGQLRRTGKHPFALTEGRSPVLEVVQHLQKLISEKINSEK